MSRLAVMGLCGLALTGCMTFKPANYQPRYSNYSALKSAPLCTVAVTENRVTKPGIDSLSVRGAPFRSPVGDDFSAFVAAALNEEFAKARVYSTAPRRTITLLMDENRLDVPAGASSATIGVTIVIFDPKTGAELARVPGQAKRQWDSSFFGATAANQATTQYSETVAELNGKLFADQQFLQALDCSVVGGQPGQ